MANYYKPLIAITVFVVFFSTAILNGDIRNFNENTDRLEQYNLTEEDLQVAPDIPESNLQDFDIEGNAYGSVNVTFTTPDNLTDPDYNTSKVAVVSEGASSGKIRYNIPEVERISTKTAKGGAFLCGTGVRILFIDASGNTLDDNGICGETDYNVPDETQFVEFELNDPSQSELYEIRTAETESTSLLGLVGRYVTSAANAMASWFAILTGLPGVLLPITLVFTIVGAIIVLEVVLW